MVGLLALLVIVAGGCGTVGPPIPPEEIGIAAKVEKEKTLKKEQAKTKETPPLGPEAVGEQPDDDLPDDVTQPLVLPR
jgi:hypothetical protein